jgi:hypothetical protein
MGKSLMLKSVRLRQGLWAIAIVASTVPATTPIALTSSEVITAETPASETLISRRRYQPRQSRGTGRREIMTQQGIPIPPSQTIA